MTSLLLLAGSGSRAEEPTAWFDDVTMRVGVDFRHDTGARGDLLFPEIMGSGLALLDYDGDGDLDLYFVQSGNLGGDRDRLFDRLFRNDRGPSGLRFRDVTERAGLAADRYGIAVAVADVDLDGWLDLYLPAFGANQLWRNRGDGTFEDWTERSGTAGAEWSAAATFFDHDGDGAPDLWVVDYVDYDLDAPPDCYTPSSRPEYCGPTAFEPAPDRFYRNLGDGRFVDASQEVGIARRGGAGLGAVVLDADDDGDPDLFVANDQMENFLWTRQDDGRFAEEGVWSGVALNLHGRPEASMGIVAADLDQDGARDLFLTHLNGESDTLYLRRPGGFADHTRSAGLEAPTLPMTGFGVVPIDVELDGRLDLVKVNGEVRAIEAQVAAGEARPYRQAGQLFANLGGGRWEDRSAAAGAALGRPRVGRGLVAGDLDLDGDDDLVLSQNHDVAAVLVRSGLPRGWLEVRVGRANPPSLMSARLSAGGLEAEPVQRRWLARDGSFASALPPVARFATAESTVDLELESRWPQRRRLRVLGVPTEHRVEVAWPWERQP